jgi:hypothetical protein
LKAKWGFQNYLESLFFYDIVEQMFKKNFFIVALGFGLLTCEKDKVSKSSLELIHVFVGSTEINRSGIISTDLSVDRSIALVFSSPLNQTTAFSSIVLRTENLQVVDTNINFSDQDRTAAIYPNGSLKTNTIYTIAISEQLQGAKGEHFGPTKISFKTAIGNIQITSVEIGGKAINSTSGVIDVPLNLAMTINFSAPLTETAIKSAAALEGASVPPLQFSLSNSNQTVTITSAAPLKYLSKYKFTLSNSFKGALGETFLGYSLSFYTTTDPTPKFPLISDDALLTLTQQQTLKYFYDFAHPASGMARERNTSGDVVTSGGSGFGLMALIVGVNRGFIPRADGIARFNKIISFLEKVDRFHGAWPHWINGATGKVIPFSANDNGADLVETSFLVQGMLTVRQYLTPTDTVGNNLINRINTLWQNVEWDWFRQNNQEVLYWHWSPDKAWIMNFPLSGYFEEQITYVLAAASPTHGIPKSVYTNGYGKSGAIKTGNSFYNIKLPLGTPSPLFWVQYSYLGLDPHFSDDYANYWEQNVNASLINHAYCVANPKKYPGYGDECWGLTASDNLTGYGAQSPTNDNGTITPTAALSSFPYTPVESMKALKFFYYTMGDRLWGQYGFYDAFTITEGWTANSYLAIDQGPIIVMIENYRTGLLWNLFMSCPEVQTAMDKLNFIK